MGVSANRNFLPLEVGFENMLYYMLSSMFVFGNVAFPMLFHIVPNGGLKFLPIYFFVLIGAYKFGWKVGLATAFLSPMANYLLTGMPPAVMLPSILVKGTVLAFIAAFVAAKTRQLSLLNLVGVILGYQFIGSLFEIAYTGSMVKALADVTIGLPGLGLQLVGGYIVLNAIGSYKPKA